MEPLIWDTPKMDLWCLIALYKVKCLSRLYKVQRHVFLSKIIKFIKLSKLSKIHLHHLHITQAQNNVKILLEVVIKIHNFFFGEVIKMDNLDRIKIKSFSLLQDYALFKVLKRLFKLVVVISIPLFWHKMVLYMDLVIMQANSLD